jgi:hypothetical protein
MVAPKLTKARITLAFAIAIAADAIQVPMTAILNTGFLAIPAEAADLLVDCFAMVATCAILGFHWLLLPSFIVEAIPELNMLPTWTGCVAVVVMQRRKEQGTTPGPDISDVKQPVG